MASVVHTQGLSEWMAGTISTSDTFKAVLLLDGFVPDEDHAFVADLVPGTNEIAETYTRPTVASVNVSSEAGLVKVDGTDISSLNLGGSGAELVSHVAIYKEVTTDANHVLIVTIEGTPKFTGDEAGLSAAFPIIFDSTGFMNLVTVPS